ncbi:hypothetical protein ACJMK2_012279 [Sinanodonta woodiana]|uniref:Elongin-B n=1 Tax=Sinanodonta woodiana TaxID=1069815 RepID=A0ABD3V7M7_SINWO
MQKFHLLVCTRSFESRRGHCVRVVFCVDLSRESTMDVFLMIRRRKSTLFTDAKESTTVHEVKKIIEGVLKIRPEDQRLYKDDQLLDDNKSLGDCGFTSATARAQAPATIGLAAREANGEFELLDINPLSSPPELPDVMKPQDSPATHAQEQTAS